MRTSFGNFGRRLRIATVLGCFCAARILAEDVPLPSSAAASQSALTVNTELESPGPSPESAVGKGKMPQRPETFETLFKSSASASKSPRLGPPPVLDQRTKKQIEDKEDWVFITPQDVIDDLMTKEQLAMPQYAADGREKSSLTPVERYYDRMNRTRQNKDAASARSLSDGSSNLDDIPGFSDMTSYSRDHSVTGLNGASARPSSLADLFGLNKSRFFKGESLRGSEVEERRQQEHLDNFRKLLEIPTTPNAMAEFNPSGSTARTPTWSTLGEGYTGVRPASVPSPGLAPLSSGFSGIPSVPAAPYAPGQAPPVMAPPTLGSTRTPPPKVDFSAPKRKF